MISPEEVNEKKISTTLQGLNVIREQGKGLTAFVESYRKLTRIPRPELNKIQVSELFSRVKILSNALEKGANTDINFIINEPGMEIVADENLITQVMLNLIKNAIEANEKNLECLIRISAFINGNNQTEICVSDNGPGIKEKNLEEIFVPFFTTREKGSGIGLSISRQIMGAHGGSLKVRSIPGKETVFCMSFRN
jgi:signal transduction histidine kinase